VIVHFTALHSDTLEAQVKAQRQVNSVTMRSFSMHDALSDAYFDLVNTQNATFTLGAQHFPRTHGNPTILRVMLLTVLDQESVADAVNWQIDYTDRAGANRQLKVVTIRSNPTVDLGAGPSLAGMSAFGTWMHQSRWKRTCWISHYLLSINFNSCDVLTSRKVRGLWATRRPGRGLSRRPCARNALNEVRCCAGDEGRSLGAGCQEQAPNHRKLRRSRAVVVNVAEKGET